MPIFHITSLFAAEFGELEIGISGRGLIIAEGKISLSDYNQNSGGGSFLGLFVE